VDARAAFSVSRSRRNKPLSVDPAMAHSLVLVSIWRSLQIIFLPQPERGKRAAISWLQA
jgi:hypothetical protein